MTQRLHSIDEYADWLKFDAVNAAAITKIAGSVVVVGACLTPAAFAMAPAVGGALGGLTGLSGAAATSHGLALLGGGSLAAGGYGMAGGAMVVAAAGGALGGTLGGVTTAAYVKADPSFKIERLCDGTGTPVIVINGFLTEGTSDWAQWKSLVSLRYPDSPVYRVFWGARELKDLGMVLGVQGVKHTARVTLAHLVKKASTKAAALPGLGTLLVASDLARNPWSVALTRADMTGAILADIIARTDQDQFILVGHSLGGRVAVRAAQSLGTRDEAPKIAAIHLLGAAISKGEDWRTLNAAVTDNVWNYHSRNDKVLAAAYRSARLGKQAVGCVGFGSSFPKIKDRDVSRQVKSHSSYFQAVQFARQSPAHGREAAGHVPGDARSLVPVCGSVV